MMLAWRALAQRGFMPVTGPVSCMGIMPCRSAATLHAALSHHSRLAYFQPQPCGLTPTMARPGAPTARWVAVVHDALLQQLTCLHTAQQHAYHINAMACSYTRAELRLAVGPAPSVRHPIPLCHRECRTHACIWAAGGTETS